MASLREGAARRLGRRNKSSPLAKALKEVAAEDMFGSRGGASSAPLAPVTRQARNSAGQMGQAIGKFDDTHQELERRRDLPNRTFSLPKPAGFVGLGGDASAIFDRAISENESFAPLRGPIQQRALDYGSDLDSFARSLGLGKPITSDEPRERRSLNTDTVPAFLTPGETVVSAPQSARLRRLKILDDVLGLDEDEMEERERRVGLKMAMGTPLHLAQGAALPKITPGEAQPPASVSDIQAQTRANRQAYQASQATLAPAAKPPGPTVGPGPNPGTPTTPIQPSGVQQLGTPAPAAPKPVTAEEIAGFARTLTPGQDEQLRARRIAAEDQRVANATRSALGGLAAQGAATGTASAQGQLNRASLIGNLERAKQVSDFALGLDEQAAAAQSAAYGQGLGLAGALFGQREQQGFERGERVGTQDFTRGERIGTERFSASESELERRQQTGERVGTQEFEAGEGEKERRFTREERTDSQRFASDQANLDRGQQTLLQSRDLDAQSQRLQTELAAATARQDSEQIFELTMQSKELEQRRAEVAQEESQFARNFGLSVQEVRQRAKEFNLTTEEGRRQFNEDLTERARQFDDTETRLNREFRRNYMLDRTKLIDSMSQWRQQLDVNAALATMSEANRLRMAEMGAQADILIARLTGRSQGTDWGAAVANLAGTGLALAVL